MLTLAQLYEDAIALRCASKVLFIYYYYHWQLGENEVEWAEKAETR